jgi:hypothetical protein
MSLSPVPSLTLALPRQVLWNAIPGMRLSAELLVIIDKLVLAGYRSESRPMPSHLNFIYGQSRMD